MNNIKFRGKDEDDGTWRYGYYMQHSKKLLCPIYDGTKTGWLKKVKENTEHWIIFDGCSDWNLPIPLLRAIVDGNTIGQYTGFRDTNNKEIYEGDILKAGIFTYRVVFDDGCFDVRCMQTYKRDYLKCLVANQVGVVIGNIYDNPELIQ